MYLVTFQTFGRAKWNRFCLDGACQLTKAYSNFLSKWLLFVLLFAEDLQALKPIC